MSSVHSIRAGMVGVGMIFDETYRPFFESPAAQNLFDPSSPVAGISSVTLAGIVSRTGSRAEKYRAVAPPHVREFRSFIGEAGLAESLASNVQAVCVATPDDRHFAAALAALRAGKHVLIEKPSVLSLAELDELTAEADRQRVLAKIVYHKLLDPDHKKLRTHVADGTLKHVNNGYCSLLEPKAVGTGQFAEWVAGRNPGTYVAVHYLKLIDFTFGPDWALARVSATGQRGLVAAPTSPTWDSVQMQVVYTHPDGREAAFDIHTSWVTPDNFPGYVDQEVQFRFDNGVWIAHQRKRGVEVCVEGRTPHDLKNTPNHHYNGAFLEPWGGRTVRGYGVEVIERFFHEVAHVEFGGPEHGRSERLQEMRALRYNDLTADRNVVAAVQSLEAILKAQADGHPGAVVKVNGPAGELGLYKPGCPAPDVLYAGKV
ncbi:MAG: Gfo/Idh/MocA family oxidoreductase [Gemmataceae bacterium]